VVWHTGLFRDLYTFGITGDNWLFFKHRYDNVASKVRWKQNLSDSIKELQGVRQGGVWLIIYIPLMFFRTVEC
jgi:hypothetical protein